MFDWKNENVPFTLFITLKLVFYPRGMNKMLAWELSKPEEWARPTHSRVQLGESNITRTTC